MKVPGRADSRSSGAKGALNSLQCQTNAMPRVAITSHLCCGLLPSAHTLRPQLEANINRIGHVLRRPTASCSKHNISLAKSFATYVPDPVGPSGQLITVKALFKWKTVAPSHRGGGGGLPRERVGEGLPSHHSFLFNKSEKCRIWS